MFVKETLLHTPKTKLWHIVILLAVCTVVAVPSAADDAASGIVDSQTFLRRNLTPAGPPASIYAVAVEKLLGQMTLKEKIGQMTQLEIGMVTDGQGQSIRINPDKLHKAVGEYGIGSILNVNDEALPVSKWQEIIRAIQEEAKRSRLHVPVLIPENTLREYFLPAFAAAVKAGAHTVMVNSSEVNGTPGHANSYLLKNVLHDELGLQGFAVSDWMDIKGLVSTHHIAANEKEATRIAVLAGIDMSMVPSDYSFSDLLLELAQEGKVPASRIDEAVRRILTVKYQLGLFDDPLRGIDSKTVIGSPESRHSSLEAARESITLLKNENHTLPLAKTARVLVTGPDADSLIPLNNGWSYTWQGNRESAYPKDHATILKAIQEKIGAANVTYVPGTTYNKEVDIAKAADAAAKADAVVLCLGEWAYAETPGNIPDLTLPDAQLNLVLRVLETKKPVILLLTEGRPRIISRIADAANAIVMAYNPGNEGGQAIADILFGDVNPSGKLPITYPRSPNRLFTYDHKAFEGEDGGAMPPPQFEFGSGLSYTSFSYSDLRVSPATASGSGTVHVEVTVKNGGGRAGKEVVQLYLNERFAS